MGPRVGRRALLTGAALLPLAACTTEPAPPPPPDPDDLLRGAAAERERALLGEYDRVLAAVPALATRLLPLRDQHAEHLLALVGPPPTGSPTPTSTPAPTPSAASALTPPPLPPELPPTSAQALAALLAVEQSAAGAHTADALAAGDRDLAGLLASLAASESSHAVALA